MDFGSQNEMEFKVVVIGEARVGKTSLSYKFWAGEFDSEQKSSVNASHLVKVVHVSDGKPDVKLNIWVSQAKTQDTAGQEKFHSLNHMYYRDANGALLVYDITDKDSFTKVREWVDELFKFAGEDVELIIAGNKYDLGKNRVVKEEDAVRFASKIGATHFNTSAKTGKNVDEVFNHMAKTLLKHREKNGTGGKRKPNNILNFKKKQGKSKVCCK